MNKTVSILSAWLAAGTLAAMTVNVESTDPDRTITAAEASALVSSGEDLVKTGGGRFIIDRSLKGYKGEIRVEGGYLQVLHNEAFAFTFDDEANVAINGVLLPKKSVTGSNAWGTLRLASGELRPGANQFALQLYNATSSGGMIQHATGSVNWRSDIYGFA